MKQNKPKSNTKKGQHKNKILAALLIALVLIGSYVVGYFADGDRSSASSYSFVRYYSQMQTGGTQKVYTSGSTYAKFVQNGAWARTLVSSSELKTAKTVCAHYKRLSGSGGTLTLQQVDDKQVGRNYTTLNLGTTSSGNICMNVGYRGNGTLRVSGNSSAIGVGIDTLYATL